MLWIQAQIHRRKNSSQLLRNSGQAKSHCLYPHSWDRGCYGFTLIELVMILVVIGILSVFAIPRMIDRKMVDARAFYDQSRSLIRYGQKIAIAQNRAVYVRLQAGSIALCFDAGCTNHVMAPSGMNSGSANATCGTSWYCEGVPANITYTALNTAAVNYVSAGNATFYFNALGQPYNTGDVPAASTFNQPVTYTITGDGTTRSFIVEHETGYVH